MNIYQLIFWQCSGDYVVVINAKDVKFTGKKFEKKQYTWHTGYPGGLKQMTVKKLIERKPEEVSEFHLNMNIIIKISAVIILLRNF